MLKLTTHRPRYTVSVGICALPAPVQDAVREHSIASENMHDYADGDYYVVLDFGLLEHDSTPDSELDKYIAGELPEEDYPVAGAAEGFDSLVTYLGWLKALRFIANAVPENTLQQESVAIHVRS